MIAYVAPGPLLALPERTSTRRRSRRPSRISPGAAIRILEALDIDVAVPQMFCVPGMTWYRGLLDLLEIPYVGNRPDGDGGDRRQGLGEGDRRRRRGRRPGRRGGRGPGGAPRRDCPRW